MKSTTLRLIALLQEGWHQKPIGDATARLWAEDLDKENPLFADEAIRNLMRRVEWRPSLASILVEVQKVKRRALDPTMLGGSARVHVAEDRPALPAGPEERSTDGPTKVDELAANFLEKLRRER